MLKLNEWEKNVLVVRPLCFFVLSLGYVHDRPIGACAPLRVTLVYLNHLRGYWAPLFWGVWEPLVYRTNCALHPERFGVIWSRCDDKDATGALTLRLRSQICMVPSGRRGDEFAVTAVRAAGGRHFLALQRARLEHSLCFFSELRSHVRTVLRTDSDYY